MSDFLLLALALVQSAALSPVRSILQKRFGYPLSAEGMREYYQKMGPADAEFWKGFKEKTALPSKLTIGDRTLDYWDGHARSVNAFLSDCLRELLHDQ